MNLQQILGTDTGKDAFLIKTNENFTEITQKFQNIDESLGTKQNSNDNALNTTSKNIVGAINENKNSIDEANNQMELKQDKNDDSLLTDEKNIVGAINENKENIDVVSQEMEQKADKNKTITRQNWQSITGTLADFIKAQIVSGNVYGSLWCSGATDMNGLAGFVSWKIDTGASYTCAVILEATNGKLYNRRLNGVTGLWVETSWTEQATTDKIDISSNLLNGWVQFATRKLMIAKTGNIVTLIGAIKDGVITKGTTLFTIPEGYRPTGHPVQAIASQYTNPANGRLYRINENGTVLIETDYDWVAGVYVFNVSYPI